MRPALAQAQDAVVLVAGALLAACCRAEPPVPPRPVPAVVCPAAPQVPPALPAVVSIERLAGAYHTLDVARQAERTRGNQCAETVRRFEQWVRDSTP